MRLRITAAVLAIALPILAFALHARGLIDVPFYPLGIPAGFLALGILVGALWRSFWACAYIAVLGVALSAAGVVIGQATDPIEDAVLAIVITGFGIVLPALLGTAIGIPLGRLIEGLIVRNPRRATRGR